MGDTYVGGMSLPGVMGLKVSRPMASLMVTADELTFTAIAPLSWLIRPRHIARSDVLAVRATAAGFGAVWWCQTSPARVAVWWPLAGFIAAAVLAVCWLGVVLTPLERSQPDMRFKPSGN